MTHIITMTITIIVKTLTGTNRNGVIGTAMERAASGILMAGTKNGANGTIAGAGTTTVVFSLY